MVSLAQPIAKSWLGYPHPTLGLVAPFVDFVPGEVPCVHGTIESYFGKNGRDKQLCTCHLESVCVALVAHVPQVGHPSLDSPSANPQKLNSWEKIGLDVNM